MLKNFFLLCMVLIIGGCSKKNSEVPIEQPIQRVETPAQVPQKTEQPLYQYAGAKFRDPFIPLTGGKSYKRNVQGDTTLDPASLMLKGIIMDTTDRMATLIDTSGNSYMIKNKRLFNRKGEEVPGVVGIVKLESVVIITEDKTVRELKLKTEEQY